ncbi:hypothetical protein B0H14DRAFT_379209 [Mycena olivaceomarginata]|nr:hypothetical protein B0H14DRAFT_379209 [Mycena olivaceomarginata]
MPLFRPTRNTSDAFAAMKVTLNAIQACTDAYPALKSCISAAIVVVEMCEKIKSNKKGCARIAERSARVVQDIWRQRTDLRLELPVEVKESVSDIHRLFEEIQSFFEGLEQESLLRRVARQDRSKDRVEEYGRLLDEAMLHFNFNLLLSVNRLQLESATVEEKRHADVLDNKAERLQLLAQIRGKVLFVAVHSVCDYDLGDVQAGKHAAVWLACGVFF